MKLLKSLGKYVTHNALPLTLMAFFPLFAFAADPAQPDMSAILIAIWLGIQNHAQTSVLLVPIFQLLRTHEVMGILAKFSGKYLQVVIALITTAGFVLDAHIKGQPLLQAVVTGLFVSGGAMQLFDAFRSINKPAVVA